jgi:thiosulfate dehydrogenase
MSRKFFFLLVLLLIIILTVAELILHDYHERDQKNKSPALAADSVWMAPDTLRIPLSEAGDLIRYGRMLIVHTANFFGPRGRIAHSANGMNCQNCHLDAGTRPWGNNYGGVYSTYPKFRERRGSIENIAQRVDDCFRRSLDGSGLDSNSREMQAILAYIQWLGKGVPRGQKPAGCGITQLRFLDRAADANKGKVVYEKSCLRCHQADGQGKLNADSMSYLYPPLWGDHSYNTGAGLYRLSRFAGYVKSNMPLGANYQTALLTDEEAWDVAAYVNSQPRRQRTFAEDWPNISLKPVDHPFGPFADSFSEQEHKYGPFSPIQKVKQNLAKKKAS